jgi:hypothetical protein
MDGHGLVVQLVAEDAEKVLGDPTYPESVLSCTLYSRGKRMTLDIPDIQFHGSESCTSVKEPGIMGYTIVPKVIKPIRAVGGSKLKLTIKVSFSACKSESSKHVSTTYRKIGGVEADLFRIYSIVVNCGCNSKGMFPGWMFE